MTQIYPIQACITQVNTGYYLAVDDIDSDPPSLVAVSYSNPTCQINLRDIQGYNTAWNVTEDSFGNIFSVGEPFTNQYPTKFLFSTDQKRVWILMVTDIYGSLGISLFGTIEFFYGMSLLPDLILLDFVVNAGNTTWISFPIRLGLLSILLYRMGTIWRTDIIQLKAMFNLKLQEFVEFRDFCISVGVSTQ